MLINKIEVFFIEKIIVKNIAKKPTTIIEKTLALNAAIIAKNSKGKQSKYFFSVDKNPLAAISSMIGAISIPLTRVSIEEFRNVSGFSGCFRGNEIPIKCDTAKL